MSLSLYGPIFTELRTKANLVVFLLCFLLSPTLASAQTVYNFTWTSSSGASAGQITGRFTVNNGLISSIQTVTVSGTSYETYSATGTFSSLTPLPVDSLRLTTGKYNNNVFSPSSPYFGDTSGLLGASSQNSGFAFTTSNSTFWIFYNSNFASVNDWGSRFYNTPSPTQTQAFTLQTTGTFSASVPEINAGALAKGMLLLSCLYLMRASWRRREGAEPVFFTTDTAMSHEPSGRRSSVL